MFVFKMFIIAVCFFVVVVVFVFKKRSIMVSVTERKIIKLLALIISCCNLIYKRIYKKIADETLSSF